jgi:hypothetical protein
LGAWTLFKCFLGPLLDWVKKSIYHLFLCKMLRFTFPTIYLFLLIKNNYFYQKVKGWILDENEFIKAHNPLFGQTLKFSIG